MRNENICLRVKNGTEWFILQQEEKTGWWMATDGTAECSATFALPACHTSSTAEVGPTKAEPCSMAHEIDLSSHDNDIMRKVSCK